MTTNRVLTSTWPFRKENADKVQEVESRQNLGREERKDGTQMGNCRLLSFIANLALLGFTVKSVVLDRNMPIPQWPSKNYGKKRFIFRNWRYHKLNVSFHNFFHYNFSLLMHSAHAYLIRMSQRAARITKVRTAGKNLRLSCAIRW